jgi:hypothetical protein
VPQLHPPPIGVAPLLDKLQGWKHQLLRLPPHHQMQRDRNRYQRDPAQKCRR